MKSILHSWITISIYLSFTCQLTFSQPCNVTDSLALVALYSNTNGLNWTNDTNWLAGRVNTWHGVIMESGRVTQLILAENNLTGSIPPEIGDLSHLTSLVLDNNQLTGSIPHEIGNLSNLTLLELGYNQLTGSIPPEIGDLSNLTTIELNCNQLSGSIPPEIGDLSGLQTLYLFHNQLTGSIPPEIGNLSNLYSLFIGYNQLTGSIPSEIGNLSNLFTLFLHYNELSGSIPPEIGNLSHLSSLALDNNHFSGNIPEDIRSLVNLTDLDIRNNRFDSLPLLNTLTALNNLNIESNKFTFNDIEPNIGIASTTFTYSPQDSVGEIQLIVLNEGENDTLSVSVGGLHNVYQWYKNAVLIPNEQNDTLFISNALPENSGVYTCRITNTVATALTLYSRQITLSVMPLPMRITSPNDGENWQVGSSHNITWTSYGTSGNVHIEFSTNNGTAWTDVIASTTDGSYPWTIPNLPSVNCLVRISDADGNPTDMSDSVFTISLAPYIAVTSPHGGENWQVGSSHNITWTSYGTGGNVHIELSTNHGAAWTDVVASTTDDSLYAWTIPDLPSVNCLIRVSDSDGNPTDMSDSVFTISPVPYITVTSPNGAENWQVGSGHNITWTSSGTSGNVHIELSTNNGTAWTDVVSSTTDDGSYAWSIPNLPSINCLVRVSDTDGNPTDMSNAAFSISLLPYVTVTSPNGAENWQTGSSHYITWTSYSTSGNVHVELSANNGTAWTDVVSSTIDNGSYAWTIPDLPSVNCLVRVSDTDGNPTDMSNAVFTISPVPPIVADSLALVALYNATGGASWTNHDNWLTGPLNAWHGVTMDSGRVIQVILDENNLNGSIPPEIGNLSKLKSLVLDINQLTGSIPPEIGKLTNLILLELGYNQLIGSIPHEIGNLSNLTTLELNYNQLSGSIPPEIGNLSSLLTLYLFHNQLTGSIPHEIGNLSNLGYLFSGYNQLTGSIPAELGNLSNLNTLFLHFNQLTGSIPAEIGNLSNLTSLALDNNHLTGSIPVDIQSLVNLTDFDISYNSFEGVPSLNTLLALNNLKIESNKFTFEDIEPNIGIPNISFTYSPQDSVGVKRNIALNEGQSYTISVTVGGEHNVYQWYKDGALITGAQNNTLEITGALPEDAGVYTCQITNTVATELTLYSRPITVIVATSGNTLTENLISYWKLDETSGGTARDTVSSHNGSVNGTQNATGKINKCVTLGSSRRITLADHNDWTVNTTDNITVGCWVNFSGDIGTYANIWGNANQLSFYFRRVSSGNYRLCWWTNGATPIGGTSLNYTTGTWYYVTMVKSGLNVTFYRNGVAAGSGTANDVNTNPTYMYLGGDEDNEYINGSVDEIAYWRRTLTGTEIANLYNSGNGLAYPFTISSNSEAPVITNHAIINGTDLQFTFEAIPVTASMNAYRDIIANFTPDRTGGANRVATQFTDEDPVAVGVQWTDEDVIGDASVNYFYIFTVVNGAESENSVTIGEFDYDLVTTGTTDFNELALPLAIPGMSTAADLLAAIPGCNSVARWNASTQGYEMFIEDLPFTDFPVTAGYPYYVNVLNDVGYTLIGELASPVFNLITTTTTDFNEVMLPLDKTAITMASALMTDIPTCNSVARWNAGLQGYDMYISDLPFTDFGVLVGYPYYVNILSDCTWPSTGVGLKKSTYSESAAMIERISAPHLVYGNIDLSNSGLTLDDLDFSAYFASSAEEKLTRNSAGCILKDGYFVIQCNTFSKGWGIEEALKVDLIDRNGHLLKSTEVQLTFDPADKAVDLILGDDKAYLLTQNVPNPFTEETVIEYQIENVGQVLLEVYSVNGQKIKTLVNEYKQSGSYEVTWNRYDSDNRRVPDGMYIYLLKSKDYIVYRKATVLR